MGARQQSLMQRMMMAMFAGALSAGDEDAAPDAAGLDRQRQLLMTMMQGIMQAGVGDMFGDDEEEAKPTKAVSESSSFVASEGAFSPGSSSSSSSSSSSGSSPAQTRAASATASKRRSSRVRQVNN